MYTLEYHGYPTYIVGGCVRDLLLGKTPHDWDITTKAKPQEVADIAIKSGWKVIQNVGNSFGVMIVSLAGQSYEVATFRSECYGEDSHRPSQVAYSEKLEDDVSRRDFTVNAMAIDKDGTLYDFFNGKEDLKNKTLRTVGSAISRFNEDALRLFRACRFLAQLGFTADQSLIAGISSALCRVSGLSLERVRIEVNKILVAPYASHGLDLLVRSGLGNSSCRVKENGKYIKIPILPELSHLVELPQMKQFHKYDVWNHTLVAVDAAPRNLITRWATLLHDVGKGPKNKWSNTTMDGPYLDHPADAIPMLKRILVEDIENLSDEEIRQICMLVVYHDIIGDCLKKDREKQQVIEVIKNEDDLDMLFAISCADVKAIYDPWGLELIEGKKSFKEEIMKMKQA